MELLFLRLDEVLEIHRDQLARYGGSPGIRDLGALKSALAMPQMGIGEVYLHEDIAAMASAYLFHLVNNHPFVDGNKRAGAAAAVVFLDLNGVELIVNEHDFEDLVLGVASAKVAKSDVATFFRQAINRPDWHTH